MSLSNSMRPLLGIADRVDLHLVFECLGVFIMNIHFYWPLEKRGAQETLKPLFLVLLSNWMAAGFSVP